MSKIKLIVSLAIYHLASSCAFAQTAISREITQCMKSVGRGEDGSEETASRLYGVYTGQLPSFDRRGARAPWSDNDLRRIASGSNPRESAHICTARYVLKERERNRGKNSESRTEQLQSGLNYPQQSNGVHQNIETQLDDQTNSDNIAKAIQQHNESQRNNRISLRDQAAKIGNNRSHNKTRGCEFIFQTGIGGTHPPGTEFCRHGKRHVCETGDQVWNGSDWVNSYRWDIRPNSSRECEDHRLENVKIREYNYQSSVNASKVYD